MSPAATDNAPVTPPRPSHDNQKCPEVATFLWGTKAPSHLIENLWPKRTGFLVPSNKARGNVGSRAQRYPGCAVILVAFPWCGFVVSAWVLSLQQKLLSSQARDMDSQLPWPLICKAEAFLELPNRCHLHPASQVTGPPHHLCRAGWESRWQVGRSAVLIEGDGGRVSASEKGGGGRYPWSDQFRTYLLNARTGAWIQLQNVEVTGTRLPGPGGGATVKAVVRQFRVSLVVVASAPHV